MTAPATTQTPYRMNFTPKFHPVEMRVSRPFPWISVFVGFLVLMTIASGVVVYSAPTFVTDRAPRTPPELRAMHAVAEAWRANHGNECPTPQRLKEEKELAASSNIADAWGTPYLIWCTGDETTVVSFGPDKRKGTEDDIVFPDTRAPQ